MGRLAVERLATPLDDPEHAAAPETIRMPMVLLESASPPAPRRPRSVVAGR